MFAGAEQQLIYRVANAVVSPWDTSLFERVATMPYKPNPCLHL